MKNNVYIILFLFLFIHNTDSTLNAQESQQLILQVSYGIDFPEGDLKDRYGLNYNPAIDLDYFVNDRWFIGIHSHILIGPHVKEDVISNIRDSDGLLVSQQKKKALITMKERGFLLGVHAGRLFNFSKKEDIHGIRIRIGSSLMSHYIVFNDESASLNQLLGPYGKGYNRFTRGLTTEEFIGYQYINKSGRLNIYGGFEFIQGYTKNLRPIDFDTRMRNDQNRIDILYGFRVGVTIPLYEVKSGDDIYY